MKFCYFLLSILLLFPLELKAHEEGENQDAPTPEQQKRWQERNDPARHADCVYSGALCDGDSVYLQKGGKISYKLVEKVTGEKTVDIEFKPYPLKDVATVGRSRCAKKPDGVSLCPGDRVQKGKEFGLVLGVFPDEKVVYATKGKPPERVSASALNPFRYGDLSKDELRNMVYGMGELNEALKLPKKAGCDDVPKPIEAEPNSAQGAGCEEKFGPISANDSPEKKHFAELLEKGLDASLEEFLHLWY
ncbi:MAG: hypothetical protein ACXVBE_17520, partial [Bdellovibrionota bacterium]